VITAPASGTGKSYLVDVAATIATGSRATCVATGSNIEEFEKSIGAELMNGRPFVLLDNLIQPLQGALLCQLMSQPTVELRDLGKSRNISLSAGVSLYATGNNVQVRGDMTRRVLVCTLDSKLERPETRAFEHDLLAEAKQRRAELVSAVLTILKWRFCWQEDAPGPWERVADLVPHAGFSEWSRRIREPLIALGHADPVLSIEQARMTDGEADVLGALLECWEATFGDDERSLRQVIELAQADLRDAIRAATRERDEPTPAKLGNYLGRVRDRPCGGKRFVVAKVVRGNRLWRVAS
jgi:putative DNA primase/helicase